MSDLSVTTNQLTKWMPKIVAEYVINIKIAIRIYMILNIDWCLGAKSGDSLMKFDNTVCRIERIQHFFLNKPLHRKSKILKWHWKSNINSQEQMRGYFWKLITSIQIIPNVSKSRRTHTKSCKNTRYIFFPSTWVILTVAHVCCSGNCRNEKEYSVYRPWIELVNMTVRL